MSEAASSIRLVNDPDVFEYPIPSTERLESHSWFPMHFRRWLKSEFRNLADPDVRSAAIDLFCQAQDEAPVGTLPTDERLLAKLAGLTLEEWNRLTGKPIGPLYGWAMCQCDNGQARLYHKTILEVTKEKLGMREDHLDKLEAERERKRLKALPERIVRAGGSTRMAEDAAFILQFDQFLEDNYPGQQRRPLLIRKALEEWSLQSGKSTNLPI
ncbi:hypothetical protein [Sulfitobacter sp.]|uniref:hypothetical protein n=1 Tax=Sulfitobacter sp. TaxID=1903071 RepID=UPI003002BE17